MSIKLKDPISSSLSGNATTATALQTSRNLTIGNSSKSFDGTSNISWSLSDIGAAATSHNHDGVYIKQALENGHYGMTSNGNTSNWVRTTSNGIIPYQSGGASSLGTSSWPFNNIYANNIYDNGTLLENKFAAISHSHSYLPLSGGTVSGDLSVAGDLNLTNSGTITIGSSYSGQKRVLFYSVPTTTAGSKANHQSRLYGGAPDSNTAFGLYDAYNAVTVFAYTDGNTTTGNTGGTKKLTVNSGVTFSATGTISSSDARLKHDFGGLDKYEEFFYDIKPCTFKYDNGTSNRDWIGVKAQEVEESLLKHNISLQEFAGIVIEQKNENDEDWRGIENEYGIRYEQFIMLNTHMIQKQKQEIDELRTEILELKEEIKELKNIVKSTA